MMFYPHQPELNETVYVVHCAHPDCNDESYAFNDIETCNTWCYKHDDAECNKDHPPVEVYEYKRVRELDSSWDGFK